MSIHFKFPGGEFHMEKKPWSEERFGNLCIVLGVLGGIWGMVTLFLGAL